MEFINEKISNSQNFVTVDNFQNMNVQILPICYQSFQDFNFKISQNSIDFFSDQPKQQQTRQLNTIQDTPKHFPARITMKQPCKCKKTQCVKLYCQCYAQGMKCGLDCTCINCNNNLRENIEKKDIRNQKLTNIQGIMILHGQKNSKKGYGCNCKKSHCQKRYCQCLNAGKKCTDLCQCIQCQNCADMNQSVLKQIEQKEQNTKYQGFLQNTIEQVIPSFEEVFKQPQSNNFIVSNQLLAEIDGYINN